MRGIFERPPRSGVFWISYTDGAGQRHREKVGRRDEALATYFARRRQVLEGNYVPPEARRRALTFRELANAAISHRKLRLRPMSLRSDLSRLGFLLRSIGAVPAAGLTVDAIEKVLDSLLERRELTGSTANRYRSLLSAIFSYGVRTGRIPSNPLALVKRFREGEIRVRYLRDDEEKKLREAIRATCPEREAELDLALYTGMRRGEMFTLRWRDVDLARNTIAVRGKTGLRNVVVNASARKALELLGARRRAGAVFVCAETQSENQRDWRRWFEDAVKTAGIDDFHFHDLRHTFASRLAAAGVDLRTVQQLMGHASIVVTMRYSHLSPDHRQAAAEKISAHAAPA
ncbi:MAG: tyrosine-type recombinase/integrase [Candidatus Acidiferrales bacterium]